MQIKTYLAFVILFALGSCSSDDTSSESTAVESAPLVEEIQIPPPTVHAAVPTKGPLNLAGIKAEVWGSYKIRQMLFPTEEWEFIVVVVPNDVRQGTLIRVAKDFYAKYPNTRARFFSDKRHIQQYVDRDRYMNDSTGRVREVDFPNSEWVQNHLLGNINNRSKTFNRHWMLEDRYGSNISLLP